MYPDPPRIRTTGTLCFLTWGTLFGWMALVCLAVAMGTDLWEQITVQREALQDYPEDELSPTEFNNQWIYYSRNRGLFRMCFPGDETEFLENDLSLDITDNVCIWEQGFKIPTPGTYSSWGTDYTSRNHLLRFVVAMIVFSIIFMLVTCIMAGTACYNASSTFMSAAAISSIFGAACGALSAGVFVAVVYYEDNEVIQFPFRAYWGQLTPLKFFTQKIYHYSFYLAWAGVGLACVAAFLFLFAAWHRRQDEARYRYRSEKPTSTLMADQFCPPPPPPAPMMVQTIPVASPPIYSSHSLVSSQPMIMPQAAPRPAILPASSAYGPPSVIYAAY